MPTYEYECGKCRRVFEVRQKISDPPLQTCEVCGGQVRRLLSPAPFILKGGGWYVTDYPSESRKKAVESEKATTGSPDKGSGDTKRDAASTATKNTPTTPASAPASSSDSTSSSDSKKSD